MQDGQDEPQGDEAEVRDQQLGGPAKVARAGIADVEAGPFDDPAVIPKLRGKLVMANIYRDDLACAQTQQDLCETTCGGADVKASLARGTQPVAAERLHRRNQLVGRTTHPALDPSRKLKALIGTHRCRQLCGW